MEKKETTPAVVQLDGKEALEQLFRPYQSEVEKYTTYATTLKIEDNDNLNIAKLNLKQLSDIKKAVEEFHRQKKAPAKKYCDAIDAVKRTIDGMCDTAISLMKGRIASYQEVQKAAAMKKAEEERKKLEEKQLRIDKDKAEIVRMARKMTAIVIGGVYYDPDGKPCSAEAPKTEKDLLAIRRFFEEKLITKRNEFHEDLRDHWDKILADAIVLVDDQIKIVNTPLPPDTPVPVPVSSASVTMSLSAMETAVNKELKKEEKQIKAEVKDASKGLYTTLQFNIVNAAEVPMGFYEISEEKINAFLRANREQIIERLKAGESNYEIIKGLHVTAVNNVRIS